MDTIEFVPYVMDSNEWLDAFNIIINIAALCVLIFFFAAIFKKGDDTDNG